MESTTPPAHAPGQSEFEALLEPILPSALKTALFLARSREDAEDLVQEAAILAFPSFERFERGTNIKAWFLKVQHNCFLGRLRHDSRRPQTVPIEDDDTIDSLYLFEQTKSAGMTRRNCGGDPAGAFLSRLDSQEIAQALIDLPDEFRAVAALYFVHEMSYEQIAHIVDCPLNTVRSRLHRARKYLQKALWELAQDQGVAPRSGENGASGKDKSKPSIQLPSWLLMLGSAMASLAAR